MERGVGDFVASGVPLVSVSKKPEAAAKKELTNQFSIGIHRTIGQYPAFGIRQIVDIALKALSPGVNDTTTAYVCVNYLGAILAELSERKVGNPIRQESGKVLVVAHGESFASLTNEAFNQIRDSAKNNPAVYMALLEAIETIARRTVDPDRRAVLSAHINLIAEEAARTLESGYNRSRVRERIVGIPLQTQAAEKLAAEFAKTF